jgi:hypothetical protein
MDQQTHAEQLEDLRRGPVGRPVAEQAPRALSPEESAVHVVDETDAETYPGLDLDGPESDRYVDTADT